MSDIFDFDDTSSVAVPATLIEQVIGQDEAVRLAKLISKQRRHLLLVGPPGTGKSMIAQSIASLLSTPTSEVSVLHNPAKPERPFLETRTRAQVAARHAKAPAKKAEPPGVLLEPDQAPDFVAERMGYLCRRCHKFSSYESAACPSCGNLKFRISSPFDDLVISLGEPEREDIVHTTRVMDGKEDLVVFERTEDGLLRAVDSKELEQMQRQESQYPRNVLLPFDRSTFVQATGASETELLGDVRHDPYGSHHQIGTPAYSRVVAGAVHEAHEGVLFVDELIALGRMQRHLLTAMQDKAFPITGRNSSSTGASVRVDKVPCDFILVAAVNTADLRKILAPLRSRIGGNGYELLINTTMPDTAENQKKLVRFVAQEVRRDSRIPHASRQAVKLIIDEARRRARVVDQTAGLTLRLRTLSGLIKTAGDLAAGDGATLIEEKHVTAAIEKSKPVEEQIIARFGSSYKAAISDWGLSKSASADKDVG
ncbi:Archaeal Lon protease [uncultured archaeon]|nr:Archaeal Lon protease [uncultured archaeon]